jgi:hypothetical protein
MKNTFAVIHNFLPGNLALILIFKFGLAAPLFALQRAPTRSICWRRLFPKGFVRRD